jgi:hypothetical protein
MAHPLAKEALQLGPVAVDLLSVSGGRETRNVFAPRHVEYIRPLLERLDSTLSSKSEL